VNKFVTETSIMERRADLDWLRIIAFGLLIFFHAAVVFVPAGIPMVANATPSPILQAFVAFLQEFRLGLLFLVSGIGVNFALRRRNHKEFLIERARRLLIPLVFGIFAIVPPMVYVEKLHVGADPGTFFQFYTRLFSDGIYPQGNLSWHHYWFVAYLFLICLISLPIFKYVQTSWTKNLVEWLSTKRNLFLFAVPLLAAELPLRVLFPGFRDLIHDWASFTHWWLLFMVGFTYAAYPQLLTKCEELRRPAIFAAILTTLLLFLQYFSLNGASFSPLHDGSVSVLDYLWFCTLRMLNEWCWVVACVGFAVRYLQRSSAVLTYLTEAVYPLFCLHLTISVCAAYWVVPMTWPIMVKYLLITSVTIFGALLLYEFGVKRIRSIRPLFGLR
jgi:glucan biosynthesis protein C